MTAAEISDIGRNLAQISQHVLWEHEIAIFSHIAVLDRVGADWSETLPIIFAEMFSDPMENWNWGRLFAMFALAKGIQVKAERSPSIDQLSVILEQFIKSRLSGWIANQGGWGAMPQFELYFKYK
jgi:hypothetical protein